MTAGIFELTAIIIIASILGIAAKLTKQPIILAYLATGIIIGQLGGYFDFLNIESRESFRLFSDFGIMFLLFLVGMEINYASLRLIGKASLIIGLAQIIFTFAAGFAIAYFFGFDYISSAYISIALTNSSTIIIVKLLSEKKDLNSLYGKISIGILLIQDFVAILILIFLAGWQTNAAWDFFDIALIAAKGAILLGLTFYLGKKIFPPLFDKIARSQELLFLTSLAWLFSVAISANKLGFSVEIGGFLAGLALADSSEHFQIAGRVKSLRDFFIVIFFVILGSSLTFSGFTNLTWPIIAFSLFVLIGNPLIILIIMGLMGYRRRTSLMTGLALAQISEFSFILMAMGNKIGHLPDETVSLVTIVGIITIIISTYLIIHGENISRRLSPILKIFERRNAKEDGQLFKEFRKPIILIGCHRTGQNIAFNIPKKDLLIIDFDPEIINYLKNQNFDYIFGDISDQEIFEAANFENARLIISTSPDFEDNMFLLSELNRLENRIEQKIILRSRTEQEAKMLYAAGADYVIIPHFTAGQYLGKSINLDPNLKILERLKFQDLEIMNRNISY